MDTREKIVETFHYANRLPSISQLTKLAQDIEFNLKGELRKKLNEKLKELEAIVIDTEFSAVGIAARKETIEEIIKLLV